VVSFLEVLAAWPLTAWPAAFASELFETGDPGYVTIGAMTLGAFTASAWMVAGSRPASLVDHALRWPLWWLAALLWPGLQLVWGVRWTGPGVQGAMQVALVASTVAGLWQLELARRARRWTSGQLRIDETVRLEAPGVTYLLEAPPSGAADGEWLTLPEIEVHAADAGPYRTGRPLGHAPEILRVRGRKLVARLALRGATLLVWSALTAWLLS
jgi:hypothetical protein